MQHRGCNTGGRADVVTWSIHVVKTGSYRIHTRGTGGRAGGWGRPTTAVHCWRVVWGLGGHTHGDAGRPGAAGYLSQSLSLSEAGTSSNAVASSAAAKSAKLSASALPGRRPLAASKPCSTARARTSVMDTQRVTRRDERRQPDLRRTAAEAAAAAAAEAAAATHIAKQRELWKRARNDHPCRPTAGQWLP